MMNQINPTKLPNSKWTAVKPVHKEKHFIVTDVEYDEESVVVSCVIEAVLSKRAQAIDWEVLKDKQHWLHGWQ